MYIVTSKSVPAISPVPDIITGYNRDSDQYQDLAAHWVFRRELLTGTLGGATFQWQDHVNGYAPWLNSSGTMADAPDGLGGYGIAMDETPMWAEVDLMSTFVDDIDVFTLVLWSHMTGVGGTNSILWSQVDGNGVGDANTVFEVGYMNSNQFRFYQGDGSYAGGGSTYPLDQTYCLVCRKDGTSNDSYIFVNGVSDTPKSSPASASETSTEHYFNRPKTGTRYGQQILIEARIYNAALDFDIIDQIYNPSTRADLFTVPRTMIYMPAAVGGGLQAGTLSLMGVGA